MPSGNFIPSPIPRQVGISGDDQMQETSMKSSSSETKQPLSVTNNDTIPMSPGLHAAHLLKRMASDPMVQSVPALPLSEAAFNSNDSKMKGAKCIQLSPPVSGKNAASSNSASIVYTTQLQNDQSTSWANNMGTSIVKHGFGTNKFDETKPWCVFNVCKDVCTI